MRTNFMAKPSRTYDEVVFANRDYAKNFGDKGKLALPPDQENCRLLTSEGA